jgi:hypothetical protein
MPPRLALRNNSEGLRTRNDEAGPRGCMPRDDEAGPRRCAPRNDNRRARAAHLAMTKRVRGALTKKRVRGALTKKRVRGAGDASR